MVKGDSLDLTARRPGGLRWDFTKASDRLKVWKLIRRERPYIIVGSPPCTMCSSLQNIARAKPGGEQRCQEKLGEAMVNLEFCAKLYRHQISQGVYFLHEPPSLLAAGGCHAWRTL